MCKSVITAGKPRNVRPGNNGNNGNSGNHGNVRPGNVKPQGPRPGLNGSNHNNHNRPGGNGHNNFRPGNPGNHGNHGHHYPQFYRPNYRPHAYYHRPQPPRPPHGWHRPPHAPIVRSVFGVNFGTALGVSLNFLINGGYTVRSYDDSQVWLRNVSIANYVWPDAALYYGPSGMDASSFYYTTPYYDPTRYNAVYGYLVNAYGAPVNYSTTHGAMSATWFGGSGYVTLTLGAASSGSYVTTLSFGM